MVQNKKNVGVLLVNLGTPEAATVSGVRKFLKAFLSDGRVVRIPRFIWWFILRLFILPFRPYKTVKAYQAIWTEHDSPMRSIAFKQARLVQERLSRLDSDTQFFVEPAMTYCRPSLGEAIEMLSNKNVSELIVLPLFPQYSSTTTAAVFDAFYKHYKKRPVVPKHSFIDAYHNDAQYIDALTQSVKQYWTDNGRSERLLMSFHGLPVDYSKTEPYYEQCEETAQLLAAKLGLKDDEWAFSFQSRFGLQKWLEPSTEGIIVAWANTGCESVDVICPGFSADCLETLEEIAMGGLDLYIEHGGKSFRYIPALNAQNDHISAICGLIINEVQQKYEQKAATT